MLDQLSRGDETISSICKLEASGYIFTFNVITSHVVNVIGVSRKLQTTDGKEEKWATAGH